MPQSDGQGGFYIKGFRGMRARSYGLVRQIDPEKRPSIEGSSRGTAFRTPTAIPTSEDYPASWRLDAFRLVNRWGVILLSIA